MLYTTNRVTFFFLLKVASDYHLTIQNSVAMARRGASRIQTPCDACKRYLDHLDEKNKNVRSFLSPMTASSKHSMVSLHKFAILARVAAYIVFFHFEVT